MSEDLSTFLARHGLASTNSAGRSVSAEVSRDLVEQVDIEMSMRHRREGRPEVEVSALTAAHLRALLS